VRTPAVGSSTLGTDFSFVCPPGAFVTQFSGVYSKEGLNHLVAGCSSGVQLPRAGGVGPVIGDAELVPQNFTNRYEHCYHIIIYCYTMRQAC
jgi:hypothetical protein